MDTIKMTPDVKELFDYIKRIHLDEVNQYFDTDYIIDILRSLEQRIDIVEKKLSEL